MCCHSTQTLTIDNARACIGNYQLALRVGVMLSSISPSLILDSNHDFFIPSNPIGSDKLAHKGVSVKFR